MAPEDVTPAIPGFAIERPLGAGAHGRVFLEERSGVASLSLLPDHATLALVTGGGRLRLIDAATFQEKVPARMAPVLFPPFEMGSVDAAAVASADGRSFLRWESKAGRLAIGILPGASPAPAAAPLPALPTAPERASFSWLPLLPALPLLLDVLALILGITALSRIGRSAGALTGRGFAIAGLVLGCLNVLPVLLMALAGAKMFAAAG